MRKNIKVFIAVLVIVGITITSFGCTSKANDDSSKKVNVPVSSENKKQISYTDGEYEVTTKPTNEGYICKAKVIIKNNKIDNVEWNIYDSNNKVFDENYEDVFTDQTYKKQCRNDIKGAKTYGSKLLETQDIEKVDAVTGATWTNNIFKNAIKLALEKASA